MNSTKFGKILRKSRDSFSYFQLGIYTEKSDSLHHICKSIFCSLMMLLLNNITMQLALWGHKHCLSYLMSSSKNISSHFMSWNWHKNNKGEGGVFIIFIYLCFHFLFFFFQFLDSPSQKNLPWGIFTKKWLLTNILTSNRSLCFCVTVCLFICLSVFWCLDYSRTNEEIFIKILCGLDLAKGRSY